MMSNWKRQGLTIQQRTQPSLGQGKIVRRIQRCSRVAGVHWGLQERTEKQGAQLKSAPHLHKDARSEAPAERPRGQRADKAAQAEIEGCPGHKLPAMPRGLLSAERAWLMPAQGPQQCKGSCIFRDIPGKRD